MSNCFETFFLEPHRTTAPSPLSTDCEGGGVFSWDQAQSSISQGPPILGKQPRFKKNPDAPPAKKRRMGWFPLEPQQFLPIPDDVLKTPEQPAQASPLVVPPLDLTAAAKQGILVEDDDLQSYDDSASFAEAKDVETTILPEKPLVECDDDCHCGGYADCYEDCPDDCDVNHCSRPKYFDAGCLDYMLEGEEFNADDEN